MSNAQDLTVLAMLLESLEVSDSLREALAAAAKLLKDCKCQETKRQESLAAVGMADAALDRLERFNLLILKALGSPLLKAGETVQ